MKRSITGRFTILSILAVLGGNILIAGFTGNNYTAEKKITTNHSIINSFTDETPPQDTVKENKKAASDSSKTKIGKLIKQFVSLFKFKDYRDKRIIELLNTFKLNDSIAAIQKNVSQLKKDWKDSIRQKYYDTLYAMIDSAVKKDSTFRDQYEKDAKKTGILIGNILDLISKENAIYAGKYAPGKFSDEDFNFSANQLFAITGLPSDIEKASKRTDRLILLQNIRDSLSKKRELTVSTKRKYSVKLKNKIEVYGFYDYRTGAAVQTERLGYLNTFIYNCVFIQSETGELTDTHGWKDADIVTTAQNHGCDVGVTFAFEKPNEDSIFLQKNSSQSTFIREAIELLEFRSGKAINISFKNISPAVKHHFFNFSKRLYETLKKTDSSYKLLLTITATTSANYPVSELLTISDRVIIDFSNVREKSPLKATPLASLSGLKDTLTSFFSSGLPKEKIVICLPYRGVIWEVKAGKKVKFINYIKYKDLRRNDFSAYASYYPDTLPSYALMDSFQVVKRDSTLKKQIYYDDVLTFSKKYEFILENQVAGVAVNGLGDDFGYTGLWDEMSYAFAEPDTVYTKEIIPTNGLTFFAKQKRYFTLYYYILQNPCVTCFENIREQDKRDTLKQYLVDLGIHKKLFEKNKMFREKNMDTWRSGFSYLSDQLTYLLRISNMILFLILLAVGTLYTYKTIKLGDSWSFRKLTGFTILGLSILFVLLLFTWLFSSDLVPFFGYRSSYNDGYSSDYINYLISNSGKNKDIEAFLQELGIDPKEPDIKNLNVGYCEPDPKSRCINMPLTKLFEIIIMVLAIGYFLTRNVIMSMIKKDALP